MTSVHAFTLLLITILVFIGIVDMLEQRIPDMLNFVLLLGGAMYWYLRDVETFAFQMVSALLVLSCLWFTRRIHMWITGRVGLGLGDVKMGGAAAVWISPLSLPLFLFIASLTGLIYAVVKHGPGAQQRIAFGPFLGLGLFSCWLMETIP